MTLLQSMLRALTDAFLRWWHAARWKARLIGLGAASLAVCCACSTLAAMLPGSREAAAFATATRVAAATATVLARPTATGTATPRPPTDTPTPRPPTDTPTPRPPTDTPTPRPPTDTPTARPPTATPGLSGADLDALNRIIKDLQSMTDAMTKMGTLAGASNIMSAQWKLDIATQLAIMRVSRNDIKKVQGSARLNQIRNTVVVATEDCDRAIDKFAYGIDHIDPASVNEAGDLMMSCGSAMRAATVEMGSR
jgi:hypothetical protein